MPNLPTPTRAYPVPMPRNGDEDPRFSMGLLYDVLRVIEDHGYPEMTGRDMVDLQQVLFCFIYHGDTHDARRRS